MPCCGQVGASVNGATLQRVSDSFRQDYLPGVLLQRNRYYGSQQCGIVHPFHVSRRIGAQAQEAVRLVTSSHPNLTNLSAF